MTIDKLKEIPFPEKRPEEIPDPAKYKDLPKPKGPDSASYQIEVARNLYHGQEINGQKTLGLKELATHKINPIHWYQNLRQQAGTAAEILGTARENLAAIKEKTGLTTYRTDDLPKEFKRNDEFVDKVVKDNVTGRIVERIQVKFVGSSAEACLSKLASPKYSKYLTGKVDKIEIPSNYYDEITQKGLIKNRIAKLEDQLALAKNSGYTDRIGKIEARIKVYKWLEINIKRSPVSSAEAMFARKHPRMATVLMAGTDAAIRGGLDAAGITAALSTIDNVKKVLDGKITSKDAVFNVAKDSVKAATFGAGVCFISAGAASLMAQSNNALITSLTKTLPYAGTAIAFGLFVKDAVIDYAHGDITREQLAASLTKSSIRITGGYLGNIVGAATGAKIGAAVGAATGTMISPGAGTLIGMKAGGALGVYVGSVAGSLGGIVLSDKVCEELLKNPKKVAAIFAGGTAGAGTGILVGKTVGAALGAATGTLVVPGYGTLVGLKLGGIVGGTVGPILGGAIGCTLAATAYKTAIEAGNGEGAKAFAGKAQEMASSTIEAAKKYSPKQVETIRIALNKYASENGIPFSV